MAPCHSPHTWTRNAGQVTNAKVGNSEGTLVPSQQEGVTVRRIRLGLPVFPEIMASRSFCQTLLT